MTTVDIPDVEILGDGGPYFGTGSPPEGDHFTPELLDRIIRDSQRLAGRIEAPFKLGHDPDQPLLRKTSDSDPAIGWVDPTTLHRTEKVVGGATRNVIRGTLRKVPVQVAKLLAAGAWRKLSAEWEPVEVDGERYMPLMGLAALGAQLPAVHSLDDVMARYEADPEPGARQYAYRDGDGLAAPARNALAGTDNGGSTVDKDTLKALGLDENATPEQIAAAVARLAAAAGTAAELGTALGAKDGESIADALARREREAEERRKQELQALRDELAPKPKKDDEPSIEDRIAAIERDAQAKVEELRGELASVKETATAGAGAASELRAMGRQTQLTQWLREGRMDPAELDEVAKELEENPELTMRQMGRRRPDPDLAREYGNASADHLGKSTQDDKKQDERYAGFMGSMGFQTLPSLRQ